MTENKVEPIQFKAETKQLLNILINSLYNERDVFLRELISNASDALTRMQFEILTNRDVIDPQAELSVHIKSDPENKTLTISDTGIGMTRGELIENLGTIAHSGAKAFIEAAKTNEKSIVDIIGQFGVGFYSAFMVADSIEVISRSYRPEEAPAKWESDGTDTYSLSDAARENRGTDIILHLKADAIEFTEEYRLRQIIKTYSDYMPFPVYFGDGTEPVNQRSSIWRQPPTQVKEEEYKDFYHQFTLAGEDPLLKVHLSIDAPVQLYALLYVPSNSEKPIFSLRKDEGIKLYARKILIQEYCKDLLPGYLRFVDGIVDSEDLPLNVSRESIQSTRVMAQLKKVVTSKLLDALVVFGKDRPDDYAKFWQEFNRAIREGLATDAENSIPLKSLLRFHSRKHPGNWLSLADYCMQMPAAQKQIYYLLGDDEVALSNSPHLEIVRKLDYDVLYMADPLDPFVLLQIKDFDGHSLINLASKEIDIPEESGEEINDQVENDLPESYNETIIKIFKQQLGNQISDVRITNRLTESPARLVYADDAIQPELERVYRALNKATETPKQVLEINPRHPLITSLSKMDQQQSLTTLVVEQIYCNALILDGQQPDVAAMTHRIQSLMETAIKNSQKDQL